MLSGILANIVLIVHLLWIIFMLSVFLLTVIAFIRLHLFNGSSERFSRFMDRWLLRTFHLCGIGYVGFLAIMGKYCPLTTLENALRAKHNSSQMYQDSFIAYYLEKLVYPSVPAIVIIIPTVIAALITIIAYIVHPPKKICQYFRKADLKSSAL